MIRSLSAESVKPKRKGNRSVSTLTPARLARKRANDREAQRTIRARTKKHIERLERELAELRSKQSRDETVQELLRRNKAIEKELVRLKGIIRVPMTSSHYFVPGLTPQLSMPDELLLPTIYDSNLSASSGTIPSPRESQVPSDYNPLPDYSQQCIPLSNNCESPASTVSCPVLPNVSTPSSLVDYGAGYIPIGVLTLILPSNNTSSSSIGAVHDKDVIKMEYDVVGHHGTIPQELRLPDMRHGGEVTQTQYPDAGFHLSNPPLHPDTPYSNPYIPHHQQQQASV
ncbi:hypothetical protein V3481_012191 [Fusarium oxysporum f. sp. vasinfectum]|nr:hypothetical protein DER44DRAFT_851478 [Fusarium oxysporum]